MLQETPNGGTDNDLQQYVEEKVDFYRQQTGDGEVASYIPLLKEANPNHLGITIIGKCGTTIQTGDVDVSFTLQSISKIISFMIACMEQGTDYVLERVDVEPTGEAFNSIMHLEMGQLKKPFNPYVNAGAITVTSMLKGNTSDEKLESFLTLLTRMIGYSPEIDWAIYESERDTSTRNRAIGYYLLEIGFLESDLELTLETYFKQCSIKVTAKDLAKVGLIIANDGRDPSSNEVIIPKDVARITKALMLTCGMYDESGKFATFVGIPAKSGVSGGIIAAVPPRSRDEELPFMDGCGIGVFGPALSDKGNSVAGIRLLQKIATDWDMSIF